MVRSNPPTWYPRGTAADCATYHRDGEWIFTEDSLKTCFFIPFHGLTADKRKALVAEALAARGKNKLRKIDSENTSEMIKGLVLVPLSPLFAFGL
jgi:hypothetical protein